MKKLFPFLFILTACGIEEGPSLIGGDRVLVALTGTLVSNTQVDIEWAALSGPRLYLVIQDGSTAPTSCTGGTEISSSSPYQITGLSPASTYTFILCEDAGNGAVIASEALTLSTSGNTQTSPLQSLVASSSSGCDSYGHAVAIAGNKALIGDTWPDRGQNIKGKVFAYELTSGVWAETQTLTSPISGGGDDDLFGTAIAMNGAKAVVGSPNHKNISTTPAGAAFYYEHSGSAWVEKQVLYPASDNEFNNSGFNFGAAVAILDNTIAVGNYEFYFTDGNSVATEMDAGAVHVYQPVNASAAFNASSNLFEEKKRIIAADHRDNDRFGISVALTPDQLIVGADDATVNNANGGAFYVYNQNDSWSVGTKIGAPTDVNGTAFGIRLAADGNTLAVSDTTYQGGIGRVYVYQRSGATWSLAQEIAAPTGAASFGEGLDLKAGRLLVGAPEEDESGQGNAGAAYLYKNSTGSFTLFKRLISDAPSAEQFMGRVVAIGGNLLLIGTSADRDSSYFGNGKAYLIDEENYNP